MKSFTFLKRPKKKMLFYQRVNHADQIKSICVSEILLSRCIRAAENSFSYRFSLRILGFVIEYA